eukprot:3228106-Pyramimonas_sp.AAC.1
MQTVPLGPAAELQWGHEACEGCAEMRGGDACGLCQWDFRRSSYGATRRDGCAEVRGYWLLVSSPAKWDPSPAKWDPSPADQFTG